MHRPPDRPSVHAAPLSYGERALCLCCVALGALVVCLLCMSLR